MSSKQKDNLLDGASALVRTDIAQALEVGAEAFLEKPVDIDELSAVILNALWDGSESSANAENTVKTE